MIYQQQHPVRALGGLVEEMFGNTPRIFRDDFFPNEWFKNNQQVPVNIREDVDHFSLEVVAPGLAKEDFTIQVTDNVLHVSFQAKEEKKEEKEAGAAKVLKQEFVLRSFKRSFRLGEKVNTDKISARYENGILHLLLPKKEDMKAVNRTVEIV